jgi:membrane protein DedA with SNARE-associated domain
VAGRRRRAWLWTILALVVLAGILLVIVVQRPFDWEPDPTPSELEGPWPYITVFLLVFGDAVIAVLPGETTLNTAATMAAQGRLDLGWVMVAGALGAVLGDSALYWIAHFFRSRVQHQLDAALSNDKVARAMDLIGSTAGALLVLGRYVPGMRFVVNASLGLAGHPYPDFLRWSAVGGVLWSIYICTVAYAVGTVLADTPVAAIAVSAVASSLAVAVLFLILYRRVRQQRSSAAAE